MKQLSFSNWLQAMSKWIICSLSDFLLILLFFLLLNHNRQLLNRRSGQLCYDGNLLLLPISNSKTLIMKNYLLRSILLCSLVISKNINAQLQINSGGFLKFDGNAILVLQNIGLHNDGGFNQFQGTVTFTGNTNVNISGSQPIAFNSLVLSKEPNNRIVLLRNIRANNQVRFNSGFLELNSFNLDLATNAFLIGENENSRITGVNGGKVNIKTYLNAPAAINPGNLGAVISSTENLDSVIIQRGHQSQMNSANAGSSILRYYDITPTNNNSLKATFRFNYFDAELNNIAENDLVLFKSNVNGNWGSVGYSIRDAAQNFVEKTNIPDFSRWTLSNPGNALGNNCDPATMQLFYVDADGDGYGNPNSSVLACDAPGGYVSNSSDCNDNNSSIHPGAIEICGNAIDDNCNGQTDEGCTTIPSLSINDVTVNEGQGSAMLTVTLSSVSSNTIQVNYKTINGTAMQPKDYKKTTGALTFVAGSTSANITVPINQDNVVEPNEYFDVELNSAINATIADGSGRVTIMDGSVTATAKASGTLQPETNYFNIKVNNPTHNYFMLNVESNNNTPLNIKITDVNGRLIEILSNESPGKNFMIGSKYFPGTYFAEITQGPNRSITKLIKL
jgi:hypothetical protein